jgi:hypothetical protein
MEVRGEHGHIANVISPVAAFDYAGGDMGKFDGNPFAFGYCLTNHNAQGSEFDDVIAFDESNAFRQHARRWLYTAVTRAAKRCVVVRR